MKKDATNVVKTGLFALAVMAVAVWMLGVAGARAATRSADVQTLDQQVHHQLVTLPWYGVFDDLSYTIEGSKVILSGDVVQPVTRSDAAAAVKRIAGVTQVENDIAVLPVSRFDDQIRRAESRALFSDPSLSRYGMGAVPAIHIIVRNGHVTLEGNVTSEMDRTIAFHRASEVHDVFSVTNNLRVG